MSAPTLNESPSLDQAMPPPPALPRLRLPLITLGLYWIATFTMSALDKPYFIGFMSNLLLAFIVTLIILGWWWFNRALRVREKAIGFALVIAEAAMVAKFADHSITPFTLWILGFPIMATLVVAWLSAAKRFAPRFARTGLVALVTLTWSLFLLVRFDGADASLKFKNHWRWTPNSEERFLAQTRQGPGASNAPAPNTNLTKLIEVAVGDWTSFRGPDRDGAIHGTTIATNWSLNPPVQVWKRSVGPAWSSLILVGNRVFTQEQRAEKETIVSYDAETGEQLWVHADLTRFDEQVSGPGPRATPTFANGRLYALGGTGLLNCLDASSGTSMWKQDIKEASGAKAPTWAFSSSPLVTDGLVMVYAGGESGKALLAYRAESGELVWTAAAGTSSYSSPQIISIQGTSQCLMLHDSGLTAFEVANGKRIWETGKVMKGAPRTGQPRLIGENKLLVAALGGLGCSLIEISKNGDQWLAAEKWESKNLKPEFPDFVVHKDHVYGFDVGIFCCIDLIDGKRSWKEGRYGRGQVMLLADQDLLLVSTETGELVLLAANSNAHLELGRFQALEGKTWNHPVVRGNRVYCRNAQQMGCYSLSTGGRKNLAASP